MATKKKDPILEIPEEELQIQDLLEFGLKLQLVEADSYYSDGSEKLTLTFKDQKRRKWRAVLEAERGSDIFESITRQKR